MQQLTIRRPDDWHLHLRDGDMMKAVLPYSSRDYGRAIIMPNLVPPLINTADVVAYQQRILALIPSEHHFTPLMTAYLSDHTDVNDLIAGFNQGVLKAAKLYPAHATTNSAHGVTSIEAVRSILTAMQTAGMPLLIHGEVTDGQVDVFDRETRFIEQTLQQIVNDFPELKIVMEHITTEEAASFVLEGSQYIAATVTPQHLLLNRNAIFQGGLRPHNYCLPILKREKHRQALVNAVTSGCNRLFLGTDSAPHEKMRKENACGCAGAFNSPVALAVYTHVFEQQNALDKLEAFCSLNGPRFYQLPVNEETIRLVKQPQTIPERIDVPGEGSLVPFLAGETLNWSVVQ